MNKPIYISIVVPVYNSTGVLAELCREIRNVCLGEQWSYEILLVDDRGKDEVWQHMKEIKQEHGAGVRIIRLSKNFGQNNATLCGIDHALGEWIVTIDDDMEYHPENIKSMMQLADEKNADVVYGFYKSSAPFSLKQLGRKTMLYLLKKAENGGNLGSSFRLIHTRIAEKLRQHSQDHLFINQVISWYTGDVEYYPVERKNNAQKPSGYSTWKLLGIGIRLIFFYTSLPLKLIIYFSFLAACVSFGFALFYFIQKLTLGAELGYTSIIVSIFLGTSIMMVAIGVLAIFVNRIYQSRIRRPHYFVKREE